MFIELPGNWRNEMPLWWRNFVEHNVTEENLQRFGTNERILDFAFESVDAKVIRGAGLIMSNKITGVEFKNEEDATAFILKWG
jgi:hypothetical protein